MRFLASGIGAFLLAVTVCIGLVMGAVFMASGEETKNEDQNNTQCVEGAGMNQIPQKYRQLVIDAAAEAEVDPSIIAAQIDNESSWNPNAYNPKADASGISQFVPDTWAQFGNGGDRMDPSDSIPAQGRYMKYVKEYVVKLKLHKNDDELIDLTLAGYNAGIGNVEFYRGIPPWEETQNYVTDIRKVAQTTYKDACSMLTENINNDRKMVDSGKWLSPLPGSRLTSAYGPRGCVAFPCTEDVRNHKGIDISKGGGATVQAPTDMKITYAGITHPYTVYYGPFIIAEQVGGEQYVFEFHHCVTGSLKVEVGDVVKPGTPLCTEGRTGTSSGVHLHFQMAKPGTDPTEPTRLHTLDPQPILISKGAL